MSSKNYIIDLDNGVSYLTKDDYKYFNKQHPGLISNLLYEVKEPTYKIINRKKDISRAAWHIVRPEYLKIYD